MTGWVRHDGRGVPPDAKPGITLIRVEYVEGHLKEWVWSGTTDMHWIWDNFGKQYGDISGSKCSRVIAWRNPSTDAAVEALKALADNPKRKFREVTS